MVEKVIESKEKKDAGSEKGLTEEWKNTLKDLEEMREAEEAEGKGDEEEARGLNGGKDGVVAGLQRESEVFWYEFA